MTTTAFVLSGGGSLGAVQVGSSGPVAARYLRRLPEPFPVTT